MISRNLSLRSLVSIISLTVVGLFLILYLSFQYFWVYEKRVSEVIGQQQEVASILDIKGSEMTASLADYAAWQDMVDFIRSPTDEFKQDSMNIHALTSNKLDSFYMFNPSFELIWGLRYDYPSEQTISYKTILPTIIKVLDKFSQNSSKDEVEAVYRYVVINKMPYLLALSRVCKSDGYDCNYGYMVFAKSLTQHFIDDIHQTTGIKIEVTPPKKNEWQKEGQTDDVSYLVKESSSTRKVLFKIHHNVKRPKFLNWDDIFALGLFSMVMFSINLTLVSQIIKPIVKADHILKKYKESGQLPNSDSFFSGELKQFGKTIYYLIQDLEESRKKLRWQSEHDSLTQLANRYLLEKELLSIIDGKQYTSVFLCLADIDHFKAYNDNYGHIKGDDALITVSSCLKELTFSQANKVIIARFGGEEFCMVVASSQSLDSDAIASKINQSIADLKIEHQYSTMENYLTLSIGGLLIEHLSRDNYFKYFQQADNNLYQAKHEGRNKAITSIFS